MNHKKESDSTNDPFAASNFVIEEESSKESHSWKPTHKEWYFDRALDLKSALTGGDYCPYPRLALKGGDRYPFQDMAVGDRLRIPYRPNTKTRLQVSQQIQIARHGVTWIPGFEKRKFRTHTSQPDGLSTKFLYVTVTRVE